MELTSKTNINGKTVKEAKVMEELEDINSYLQNVNEVCQFTTFYEHLTIILCKVGSAIPCLSYFIYENEARIASALTYLHIS